METEALERDSLARYVPRASAEWERSTDRLWRELDGTLCYIDISGFTALSEKLARRGRIGAEELTETLNYVFGQMLAIVYDRGGSLLKFGGDALLLLFQGTDHPLQACSAAVEMQAALREARSYRTSAGRLHLKMSVGLHSGTIHLFRVGDSHNELILTGPAASVTTEMEETAEAGEILISSATRELLPPGAATVQKGSGWLLRWRKARVECCGWTARIPLKPEAVAAGMPVALREYLQYGVAEPEHRIATVAFIKFGGVDALMGERGPEAVAEALNELVENVQSAADSEGVTFLASDLDEDGGKIILVAGVPGAQEDDEGRVLRTARRIADQPATLTLRIGINQGHVFAGEVGTDFRATYTVMGDTVNLAARLMAAASPGEVYASPAALDRSRTLFETTALEPFSVKGKVEPVKAYAVGNETGSRATDRSDELPYVGRADEVAQLITAVENLKNGKGGAIAIIGETGIGKSRLVDQALPALGDTHHVNIRSEPYGIATPYRPLRDPLRLLLGVERGAREDMESRFLESVKSIDPALLPMVPLIADVAMVEVDSTPEVDAIDPKFRQDRTADVVVELLGRALAGPVLFEAEDGHWMDEASVHVMNRIVAATAERPWLVLTTRRDEEGGLDPGATEIRIGPLTDDDARRLIIEATAAAPLRPHDLEAIVARAGGLPLFLEEIIRAVRGAGGVETLPDSLDAVVAAQIDGLAPLPRRVLRIASVLGRSFRTTTLQRLIADDEFELDAATREQLAGFLDPDGDERLLFRHALFRDVAYEGLSFRRRRELHLRAGEVMELDAGDHPDSIADVLALHYFLGGDHDRTWRYARIAGDQARDTYANVEAAEQYERALESVRRLSGVDVRAVADVWSALGDVQEKAGLYEDSIESFGRAVRLVSDDVPEQAYLLFRRARSRMWLGAYRAALRDTSTGLKLVGSAEDGEFARTKGMLNSFRAMIRQFQQRPREALDAARDAVAEARRAQDDETLARAYLVMDWSYRVTGQPEKAVYSLEALEILERLGHLTGVVNTTNNLGAAAFMDGQWDEAIDYYTRSHDAAIESGNQVRAAVAASNIGEVLVNQGRFEEAEDRLGEAMRVLRASNNPGDSIFAELQFGRVLIARERYEEAERLLTDLRSEALSIGESFSALEASLELARAKAREGKPTIALELLDEASSAAGDIPSHVVPSFALVEAQALMALGRFTDAGGRLEAGLTEAERQGMQYEHALLRHAQAELARRSGGEPDPAGASEAKRTFARLGVLIPS